MSKLSAYDLAFYVQQKANKNNSIQHEERVAKTSENFAKTLTQTEVIILTQSCLLHDTLEDYNKESAIHREEFSSKEDVKSRLESKYFDQVWQIVDWVTLPQKEDWNGRTKTQIQQQTALNCSILASIVKFCDQYDNLSRNDIKKQNGQKYNKLYSQKLVDVMQRCVQNKNVTNCQKHIMKQMLNQAISKRAQLIQTSKFVQWGQLSQKIKKKVYQLTNEWEEPTKDFK